MERIDERNPDAPRLETLLQQHLHVSESLLLPPVYGALGHRGVLLGICVVQSLERIDGHMARHLRCPGRGLR